MRRERHLSIVEIAERLVLPKTTIYSWVRDLPLERPRRENAGPANRAISEKHRAFRQAAYDQGKAEFARLAEDPTFRDFVCLYVAEGLKRNRNRVAVGNSDPAVVALCARWIRVFARNRIVCAVQYHTDQDLVELKDFWSRLLDVSPAEIRTQRKSNSGRLGGRNWRSRYGVLTLTADDTLLRARLQGWIDSLQEQWLDSPSDGA